MTDDTVNVTYRARANFSELIREATRAKAAMAALRAEGDRAERSTIASSAASASARARETRESNRGTAASKAAFNASKIEAAGRRAATRAIDDQAAATRRVGRDTENAGKKAESMGRSNENAVKKMLNIKSTQSSVTGSLNKIQSGLNKISNWRPNLTPSFLILIPAIGGVLSLINPLVAGVGALGAAAIGTASSLGSLAGAAVGLVPALSAALGVALALRTALGGVGGAISAGIGAASSAGGAAGGAAADSAPVQSPFGLTAQEKITRAQRAYRDAVQDVGRAERNVSDARRAYRRQVDDLTNSIQQYTAATKASDAASVGLAQQNYNNVLASSSSTKAERDAALAAIGEAKQRQSDDAAQNARDQQDLAALRRTGENNDQGVLDAKRGVQDAKDARRDAQLALRNEKYNAAHPIKDSAGSGAAGGAAAADPYAAALAQLSPSAQKFVKWVVGMRDAWEDLQKTVQEAFFSQFVGDLDRLKTLLPPVRTALVAIAGALGKITDNLIKQVTSKAWRDDIAKFGKDLAPILLIAGEGLQALLDAFKDLTMAGLPFLKDIVTWLSDGAKNFAAFVKEGRKSGSIAKYLDDVFDSLQQWWRIVKNIAGTLVNYGSAAKPFGDWMTNGLEKVTGDWLKASEDAKKKGSPFKVWLERTKPVLRELKADIGSFFSWVATTASDPENLKSITDVLKTFRIKIGPDVANILKSLTEAKVPQKFTDAIASLTGLIDTLMKNGGARAIGNFFTTLSAILDGLDDAAKSPIGRFVTNTFLPLIGTLAVFALPAAPVNLLIGLLAKLAGFKPGAVLSKVPDVLKGIGAGLQAIAQVSGLPAIVSALGGILGVLAAPIVIPKDLIPKSPDEESRRDTAGGPLKIDTDKAKKALTLFAGGVPALIAKYTGDAFRYVGGPGKWATAQSKKISTWASRMYRTIASSAGDVWRNVQTAASWLRDRASEFVTWAGRLNARVASAAGSIWRRITGPGSWLGDQTKKFTTWASGIPDTIGRALKGLWNSLPSLGGWLNSQVKNLGAVGGAVASALGLPGAKKSGGKGFGGGGTFGGGSATGRWAGTISQALKMAGAPASWGADIATIIQHESSGNPKAVNNWDSNAKAGHPSQGLMQTIPSTFNAYAGSLAKRGITDPLANIYAGIRYIQSRYGSPGNLAGIKSVNAGGNWIGYSAGGHVPGTGDGDTVPAKLTPGEFVVPKALVKKIGIENLEALRMGSKSFGELLAGMQQSTYAMTTPQVPMGFKQPTVSRGATTVNYNTNVVNAVPERASESIPRSLRKVAYLHQGVR